MTEQINDNYQHSSGPVQTITVPYARLTDAKQSVRNHQLVAGNAVVWDDRID